MNVVEIAKVQDENGLTHLVVGMNCHLQNLDYAILLSGHMDTVKPGENWDTEAKVEEIQYHLSAFEQKPSDINNFLCDYLNTSEGEI